MAFDETRRLLEAFRGLIEEIGSQAEELAALYQETAAMQSELEDVNRDLKTALEQLEELALFSQTAAEARSTKEAATQLLSSFTAFGGARCGGMVLLRDAKPTLVAYEGDPEGKEELLQYLKNADGKNLVRPSEKNTPRCPGTNGFDGDGRRWYVFPISYLGADLGGLFLAEEGSRGEVLGKVQNVIALFVPHVGGILRAHLLVDEVRRSYHYLALRLQGLTAAYHDETGEHLQRIRALSLFLGERMGLDEELLEDLAMYSMLHDIGKMKVPHEILSKPARLDEEEFAEIRRHTLYGVELLGESRWLDMAREICLYHHEKWDGSGYPEGLAGEEIPLVARIVGFVDVYDALRSRRSYKDSFSHEMAFRILTEGDDRVRPTDFDPRIMAVFRAHHAEFDKIYKAYSSLS
jgi:HD-GYP domain-containing protein (c-di-GMP phosphodiesterase class II)